MSLYQVHARQQTGAIGLPNNDVSPQVLLRSLSGYGTEECGRICLFIREVCGPEMCRAD